MDQKVAPTRGHSTEDTVDNATKPAPLAAALLGTALENQSGLILNITADSTKLKRKQMCDTAGGGDSDSEGDSDTDLAGAKFRSSSPERLDEDKTVVKVPDPTEKVLEPDI